LPWWMPFSFSRIKVVEPRRQSGTPVSGLSIPADGSLHDAMARPKAIDETRLTRTDLVRSTLKLSAGRPSTACRAKAVSTLLDSRFARHRFAMNLCSRPVPHLRPAFVINETGKASRDKPFGHLFIGTTLNYPVLYYGTMNHCGPDQRITVFFNRALRDRADHHLTIMQSTSGQPDAPSGGGELLGPS
jgi:hypothetical protein